MVTNVVSNEQTAQTSLRNDWRSSSGRSSPRGTTTMAVWQRQLIAYHPVIGWWFIPNLKAMIPHNPLYLLRTNSFGMRSDREYPLARRNGRRRIVLLGDSYAAGSGVSNNDRFSDLLEKSYPNLDVMNFGLPGTGTDQQVLIYETYAKPFEADAYIFAPFHDNIVRNQAEIYMFGEHGTGNLLCCPKPYFTLEGNRLVPHNQPVPNQLVPEKEAMRRLGALQYSIREVDRETPQWVLRNAIVNKIFFTLVHPYFGYESDNSESWRLMRAIIEKFIRQVSGKPVFIVPIPDFRHYMFGLTPTYWARFAKLHDPGKNCFVLDLLPYFNRLSPEDRRKCRFRRDPHYSPLGHRVVAEAISDTLARYCPKLLT
jgi:hypothetical protein